MPDNQIDFDAVLSYQHEETILRFLDSFAMTKAEAEDIFREMKLLLCLFAKYPDEYIFTHEPLWVIDEMWHTFLMYTKDYQEFCTTYFGKFLHHQPTQRARKLRIIEQLEVNKEATEKQLRPIVRNLYEKIYDFLGPETLVKWLEVYGQKYTLEYMNTIRKPLI